MLSDDQKKQRIECCRRQVERFEREGDEFLRRIITVDETWIKLYEPETKEHSTTSSRKHTYIFLSPLNPTFI